MKSILTSLLLAILFLGNTYAQTTLYVDSARVSSGDGGSWATAFKHLHEAFDSAWRDSDIAIIRVAEGSYAPMEYPYVWNSTTLTGEPMTLPIHNRHKTFHIRQGLELYGGYPSGGGTRDIQAHPSILTGAGVGGIVSDSAYHVMFTDSLVSWPGGFGDTTIISGFTITQGRATVQGGVSINGTTVQTSRGGGVYIQYANALLSDNIIVDNVVDYDGGGCYGYYANCNLQNNTINNNSATFGGGFSGYGGENVLDGNTLLNNTASQSAGGYYSLGGIHTLYNNTFIYNSAFSDGGGYVGNDGTHTCINNTFYANSAIFDVGGYSARSGTYHLSNNVFWQNSSGGSTTTKDADLSHSTTANVYANFNCFQLDSTDYEDIVLGANNLYQKNPLFIDSGDITGPDGVHRTKDDGLRLMPASPAINTGSNDSIPMHLTRDILGNSRIQESEVDLGAYEGWYFPCLTSDVLYVDSSNVNPGDGTSWATAFNSLNDALLIAWSCSNIARILVAKGIYSPSQYPYNWNSTELIGIPITSSSDNQDKTFHIRQGLELFGGYPGGGGARDPVSNPTVLSGAGVGEVTTDSAYHVILTDVLASWPGGYEDTTVIDGFTISHGRAMAVGSLILNGSDIPKYAGGGIYGQYANLQLKNNNITENRASYSGGGIYGNYGSYQLSNNTLSDNTATFAGGYYANDGVHTLQGNTFINNTAGFIAGAYYGTNGIHSLYSNSFIGNLSDGDCGAYHGLYGMHNIINNTFYANTAIDEVGGCSVNGGIYAIHNNIFWGNTSRDSTQVAGADIQNVSAATVSADFNIFQLDSTSGYNNISLGVNNIYQQNPLFTDTTNITGADGQHRTADDGLHLGSGSPAFNAGSNDSIPYTSSTDITGGLRINYDTVDIGAYESTVFPCGSATVLYVDSSLTTSGDGSSWSTAFTRLEEALFFAWQCAHIDSILIARGTYTPMEYPYNWNAGTLNGTPMTSSTDNRDKTFHIRQGLELYGGYPSAGGIRDIVNNPTVLDGAGVGDIVADSSYHVVLIHKLEDWPGGENDTTVLNGFTVTNGRSETGTALLLNGYSITQSYGAGVFSYRSNVRLKNNTLANNKAISRGGGYYCYQGSLILENNTLIENSATNGGGFFGDGGIHYLISNSIINNAASYGGGGYKLGGSLFLHNNSIVGNTASVLGGGFYGSYGTQEVTNNTFYDNSSESSGGGYFGNDGIHNLNNCIFSRNTIGNNFSVAGADVSIPPSSGSGFTDLILNFSSLQLASSPVNYEDIFLGNNNLYQQDPLFVDTASIAGPDGQHRTADDGLELMFSSPAINMGKNSSILAGTDTDIVGAIRIQDSIVDMGAYESEPISCVGVTTLYVDSARVHSGPGLTWETAFKYLQDALHSECLEEGDTIRVAIGTYYPDHGIGQTNGARDATFELPSGVVVLGGFSNNGANRDTTGHLTVLSGNIGDSAIDSINSYHVVFVDTNAVAVHLDGFSVTSGYASGSKEESKQGAGLLCRGTMLGSNLIFENNNSIGQGAAIYVKANGELTLLATTIELSNMSTSNIIIGNDLNSELILGENTWIK